MIKQIATPNKYSAEQVWNLGSDDEITIHNPTTRILQDQSFFFFSFFFSVTPRVPPPDVSQTWTNGFLQSF